MMRIALFCATRRGLLFLRKLKELAPGAELVVFSFKEEPHEPPFLEEIRREAQAEGGAFNEVMRSSPGDVLPALAEGFDLLFAVSWRYLIPPVVYQRARIGSFALHDSLLPKYRGFSPTIWAMINGERETGATLFEMTERADEGAIVDQQGVEILESDTIAEVLERVTESYLRLLERNIAALLAGKWQSMAQDHSQASYCRKRRVEDNRIDWNRPTREVLNLVRALTRPYPGAFTSMNGGKVRIWSAASGGEVVRNGAAGKVLAIAGDACMVGTADGAVAVHEVQVEGEEARPAADVLGEVGKVLG